MSKIKVSPVLGVFEGRLDSFKPLSNTGHYKNLRTHMLRQGAIYDGVDYKLQVLKDGAATTSNVQQMRHFVFDFAHRQHVRDAQEAAVEVTLRPLILHQAYNRIIRDNFDDKVKVATIVGGDNVRRGEAPYPMYDALHVIFEGLTDSMAVSEMITMFYIFLDQFGYVTELEPREADVGGPFQERI